MFPFMNGCWGVASRSLAEGSSEYSRTTSSKRAPLRILSLASIALLRAARVYLGDDSGLSLKKIIFGLY